MEVCFLCWRITLVLTPHSVGTIGSLVDPPTNTWSNGITPPTPVFTPSEIKRETTNMVSLLESQPSRYPLQSLPGGTQGMASGSGGTVPEFNTSAYYNSIPDLFDVKNQSSSATPDQKYDFHSEEPKWFSDPGAGDEKTAWLPMRSPPSETKDVGYERLDKRKRAMTPDEAHKMRRTLPEGSQSSESSISKSLPLAHDGLVVDPFRAQGSLSTTIPHWVEHKIPQRPYNHGPKQRDFRPSQPITFSVNGLPGVNMGAVLSKRFTALDGRDDPVLQGAGSSISCRLEVS